jgi:hypothetical protein
LNVLVECHGERSAHRSRRAVQQPNRTISGREWGLQSGMLPDVWQEAVPPPQLLPPVNICESSHETPTTTPSKPQKTRHSVRKRAPEPAQLLKFSRFC